MRLETHDVSAAVEAVSQLLLERPAACGPVHVIAVDGPSGAGKTTVSALLEDALVAPVLHLDDIYPGWDGLAQVVPLVTTQVLQPLAAGERAAYRRWDWVHHRWTRTVPVPSTDRLVLDGVGSSVRPAGDYAAVCVWVEARPEVRFARAIARDGEGYRPHWERWAAQEAALFAADGTRERADVVLDTSAVELH